MKFTLQSIFNALAVIPSFDKGVIYSNNLTLSGDGSSLHIPASAFGHKVIESQDEEDNKHRYSAPEADSDGIPTRNVFSLAILSTTLLTTGLSTIVIFLYTSALTKLPGMMLIHALLQPHSSLT